MDETHDQNTCRFQDDFRDTESLFSANIFFLWAAESIRKDTCVYIYKTKKKIEIKI